MMKKEILEKIFEDETKPKEKRNQIRNLVMSTSWLNIIITSSRPNNSYKREVDQVITNIYKKLITPRIMDIFFPVLKYPKTHINQSLKPIFNCLSMVKTIRYLSKKFYKPTGNIYLKNELIDHILWKVIYNLPTPIEKRNLEKKNLTLSLANTNFSSSKPNTYTFFSLCYGQYTIPLDIMNHISNYLPKNLEFLNSVGLVNENFYLFAISRFKKLKLTNRNIYNIPIFTLNNIKNVTIQDCGNKIYVRQYKFLYDNIHNTLKKLLFYDCKLGMFNYINKQSKIVFYACELIGILSDKKIITEFSRFKPFSSGSKLKPNSKELILPSPSTFPRLKTMCIDHFNIPIYEIKSSNIKRLRCLVIGRNVLSQYHGNVEMIKFLGMLPNLEVLWLECNVNQHFIDNIITANRNLKELALPKEFVLSFYDNGHKSDYCLKLRLTEFKNLRVLRIFNSLSISDLFSILNNNVLSTRLKLLDVHITKFGFGNQNLDLIGEKWRECELIITYIAYRREIDIYHKCIQNVLDMLDTKFKQVKFIECRKTYMAETIVHVQPYGCTLLHNYKSYDNYENYKRYLLIKNLGLF